MKPWARPRTVTGRSVAMEKSDGLQTCTMIAVEMRQNDVPNLEGVNGGFTSLGSLTPCSEHGPGTVDGEPTVWGPHQSA